MGNKFRQNYDLRYNIHQISEFSIPFPCTPDIFIAKLDVPDAAVLFDNVHALNIQVPLKYASCVPAYFFAETVCTPGRKNRLKGKCAENTSSR